MNQANKGSEKYIERQFADHCKKLGWLCLKYYNPITSGYPDRIIIMPGGRVAFAEIKTRGKHAAALQRIRMEELHGMGVPARVIDSMEAAEKFITDLKNEKGI